MWGYVSLIYLSLHLGLFVRINAGGKDACKDTLELCPCGKTSHVVVRIRMCEYKDPTSQDYHCRPCDFLNPFEDICSRFRYCQSCFDDLNECKSCPKGRFGTFCEFEELTRQETIGIESQLAIGPDSKCSVFDLKGEDIKCSQITTRDVCCFVTCFGSGRNASFVCSHGVGTWRPIGDEDCEEDCFGESRQERRKRCYSAYPIPPRFFPPYVYDNPHHEPWNVYRYPYVDTFVPNPMIGIKPSPEFCRSIGCGPSLSYPDG